MNPRVKRVYSNLVEEVDAIVLINGTEPNLDLSFFYMTEAESGLFEECVTILWPDGSMELISSKLEETSAGAVEAKIKVFENRTERDRMLKNALKGVKRLGINGTGISYKAFKEIRRIIPSIHEIDVCKSIEKARLVKDEKEIGLIREACRIASEVAEEIPDFLEVGMTETEATAEISYRMQRKGANSPSFDPNASFGENSAEPHHTPGTRRLKPGDLALFDFGAKYKRYCSDITRTFPSGRVTKEVKEMYATVLESQRVGIESIRAGVNGKDVDAAARKVIDRSEFKGKLIHSLGHGLGLSVHDGGRMAPEYDFLLEENYVLTVEPGIYLPGIGGIRIEDNVRVTADGCEVLTSASREMRRI